MAEGFTMQIACIDCSRTDACCCCGVEIYLTGGDVSRITKHNGISADEFSHFVAPTGIYVDAAGDPGWNPLVLRPDGTRRIVKLRRDGSCTFLTSTGCSLPLDVRPLLCRIHPYDFDRQSLKGVDADCPISAMPDQPAALKAIGMPRDAVATWHRALYSEILADRL